MRVPMMPRLSATPKIDVPLPHDGEALAQTCAAPGYVAEVGASARLGGRVCARVRWRYRVPDVAKLRDVMIGGAMSLPLIVLVSLRVAPPKGSEHFRAATGRGRRRRGPGARLFGRDVKRRDKVGSRAVGLIGARSATIRLRGTRSRAQRPEPSSRSSSRRTTPQRSSRARVSSETQSTGTALLAQSA